MSEPENYRENANDIKIIYIEILNLQIGDYNLPAIHLVWRCRAVRNSHNISCDSFLLSNLTIDTAIFQCNLDQTKPRWHTHSERSRWASSATHILGQRHCEVGWPVPFFAVVGS